MARRIPCALAAILVLLGFLDVVVGRSPRLFALGSVTSPVHLDYLSSGQVAIEQQAEPAAMSAGRFAAEAARASDEAFDRPGGLATEPGTPPGRPQLRPFWASGPLVTRMTNASFGPRPRPDGLLTPEPPVTLAGASNLMCLAVAIYHEARDQPLDGQLAVASVVLNRTREPRRWGSTPCEVVIPGQFSFMTGPSTFPPIEEIEAWAIAVEMAREALERGPSPLVEDADHYHTLAVEPVWNDRMKQVIRIDDHVFFIDPATQG